MEANDIAIKVTMRDLIYHQYRSVPGFTDMVRNDAKIRNSRMDMVFGPAIATGYSKDIVQLLALVEEENNIVREGQHPKLDAPVFALTFGELVKLLSVNKTGMQRLAEFEAGEDIVLFHLCGNVRASIDDIKTILAMMRIKGEL